MSWDPAQAEIDGYILTYTSSEGSSEEIPVGSDRTSYMLTSLRPGVLYTVYIWAVKGDKATRKISTKAQTGQYNMNKWIFSPPFGDIETLLSYETLKKVIFLLLNLLQAWVLLLNTLMRLGRAAGCCKTSFSY